MCMRFVYFSPCAVPRFTFCSTNCARLRVNTQPLLPREPRPLRYRSPPAQRERTRVRTLPGGLEDSPDSPPRPRRGRGGRTPRTSRVRGRVRATRRGRGRGDIPALQGEVGDAVPPLPDEAEEAVRSRAGKEREAAGPEARVEQRMIKKYVEIQTARVGFQRRKRCDGSVLMKTGTKQQEHFRRNRHRRDFAV